MTASIGRSSMFERILVSLWLACAGVTVIGLIAIVGAALNETLITPGASLVDGYWIGRLPWIPIGVGMVLGGATAALLFGALLVLLIGGWPWRIAAVGGMLAGAWWWGISMILGLASSCAPPCPRGRPDPDIITIAYSSPEAPLLFVVLPALVVSVLVVLSLARRAEDSSRQSDR